MARSAVVIQADIDKLSAAIGTGALRVRFADRDVTYRSLAEMIGAKAMLEQELAAAQGATRTRQLRFNTSKGL